MGKKNKKKDGHFWVKLLLGVVYIAILIAFAIQTWELVDWMFPAEQQWMKIVTVFSFDVMAGIYTLVDMFFHYKSEYGKTIIKGMWYVSFTLSVLASVLEMYMQSAGRLQFTYDPNFIRDGYAMVIIAFTVNIIALTFFIRGEYEASLDGDGGIGGMEETPLLPRGGRGALVPAGGDEYTLLPSSADTEEDFD